MEYREKYLKYKNKYLNLKKQLGGALDIKNALVMGGGPVGLVTTLSLLTRYPYRYKGTKTNCLDCNTIFLFEKSHPWRPQIFFFQNSFRDYSSIDFIRDIDLETYKRIEKIGCYIGSPPSTRLPYCYSSTKLDANGNINYTETALSSDKDSIRAPSSIDISGSPDNKLYLMHHISFHVSDLETILLDRIITLNKVNIDFYNSQTGSDYDMIKAEVAKVKSKFKDLICNYELVSALLIKDKMISDNKITAVDFKPLVVIVHPYNKFCNINSYILYKLIKNNIKLYLHLINDTFINEDSFDENWEIKKNSDMSINFKLKDNPDENTYKILTNDEYDLVFECESINKQFGDKSDYWFLKNRDKMNIIDNTKELEKNNLLAIILDKNSIIQLKSSTNDDIFIVYKRELECEMNMSKSTPSPKEYIFLNKFLGTDVHSVNFKIYLKKLNLNAGASDINDLNNYTLDNTNDYLIKFSHTITAKLQGEINTKLSGTTFDSFQYKSLYQQITKRDYDDEENKPLDQLVKLIHTDLYNKKISNINIIVNQSTNINYTNIFKINSLMIEEKKIDLSKESVKTNAENAIVNASVLLYDASGINMLFDDKYVELKNKGSSGVLLPSPTKIPLCAGPLCATNDEQYDDNYKKTQKLRKRVDKKSMINQIYINNDQVQYFNNTNNSFGPIFPPDSYEFSHIKGYSHNPQHAFRVFGVNTNNKKLLSLPDMELQNYLSNHDDLKKYLKLSTTNPYFYNGIQISSEINTLYRNIKNQGFNDYTKKFLSELIFINLYIMGHLYTTNKDYTSNIVDNIYVDIIPKWNNTYKLSANTIDERIRNPINNNMLNIFAISLKYKEKPIEKELTKTIFNMGDSNATVNFFSGTGLNTGIANIKIIMENYDFVESNTTILNENIKNKSRRTIYNSLLSSQNPSYISPLRKFKLTDGTQLGFYETKLSEKKTFIELQNLILENLKALDTNKNRRFTKINDLLIDLIQNFDTQEASISIKNILGYLKDFDVLFTRLQRVTDANSPLSPPNSADVITDYLENIKKALYYNIYVCLYNIYFGNPVLTSLEDYDNECITYANHLHFNHFDACNFLIGDNIDNNKPYYCDMLYEPTVIPSNFDSRRITQYNNSYNFTT